MDMDKDVLQAALARAITDSVTPEVQKEVFRNALTGFLFRADTRGDSSPISEAFKRALQDATIAVARDVVAQPENRMRIVEAVKAGLDEALKDQKLVESITTKFIRALGGW